MLRINSPTSNPASHEAKLLASMVEKVIESQLIQDKVLEFSYLVPLVLAYDVQEKQEELQHVDHPKQEIKLSEKKPQFIRIPAEHKPDPLDAIAITLLKNAKDQIAFITAKAILFEKGKNPDQLITDMIAASIKVAGIRSDYELEHKRLNKIPHELRAAFQEHDEHKKIQLLSKFNLYIKKISHVGRPEWLKVLDLDFLLDYQSLFEYTKKYANWKILHAAAQSNQNIIVPPKPFFICGTRPLHTPTKRKTSIFPTESAAFEKGFDSGLSSAKVMESSQIDWAFQVPYEAGFRVGRGYRLDLIKQGSQPRLTTELKAVILKTEWEKYRAQKDAQSKQGAANEEIRYIFETDEVAKKFVDDYVKKHRKPTDQMTEIAQLKNDAKIQYMRLHPELRPKRTTPTHKAHLRNRSRSAGVLKEMYEQAIENSETIAPQTPSAKLQETEQLSLPGAVPHNTSENKAAVEKNQRNVNRPVRYQKTHTYSRTHRNLNALVQQSGAVAINSTSPNSREHKQDSNRLPVAVAVGDKIVVSSPSPLRRYTAIGQQPNPEAEEPTSGKKKVAWANLS